MCGFWYVAAEDSVSKLNASLMFVENPVQLTASFKEYVLTSPRELATELPKVELLVDRTKSLPARSANVLRLGSG